MLGLREELHSTHTQLSRLQEEADTRTLTRTEARGVVKGRGLGLDMPSDGPPSETRTSGVVCNVYVCACDLFMTSLTPRVWIVPCLSQAIHQHQ